MVNNARATLAAVWPNRSVILNMGLMPGSSRSNLLPQQRTVVYSTMLKEIMRPGYRAELSITKGIEPTLVVSGVFNSDAPCSLLLWDTVCIAEQDCIAIYYPDEEAGALFGPRSDIWGDFNLAHFVMPTPKGGTQSATR